METSIIRQPSEEEKKDFVDISRSRQTAEEKFKRELVKQEKQATIEGKPFAARVALDEWNEHYQNQAKLQIRKYGYVKPEEVQPLKMDWKKYSDLKNFELIDEGYKVDDYLTKINPGLTVMVKWKKYQFKGYSNTYRVMESGPDAIARAKKEAK